MKPRWLDRYTVRAPHLALCLSNAEYKAAAKHCGIDDAGSWLDEDRHKACVSSFKKDGNLICLVSIHPDALVADPIEVAAALCHEAVHVFQRLCDCIGEDEPSREFEANSIEHIAEQLMREFARRVAA